MTNMKTIYIDGKGALLPGQIAKYITYVEQTSTDPQAGIGPTIEVKDIPGERVTNNEAEYKGLIEALTIAEAGDKIITDSQLLVGHITQGWKVKAPNLRELYQQAKALFNQKTPELVWVMRSENKAGIYLDKLSRKERYQRRKARKHDSDTSTEGILADTGQ